MALRPAAGSFGKPAFGLLSFFCLTAARNGRISEIPQPRIEGRGITSAALARPSPPTTLGVKLISTRITMADMYSGLCGFQVRFGIAEIFCSNGIREDACQGRSGFAARESFIILNHLL